MANINKKLFALIIINALLYDCIFINLMYKAENRADFFIFPPKLYRIVSAQTVLPTERCLSHGSCKNIKEATIPVCYCDSACIEYDDCCYDSSLKNDSQSRVSTLLDKKEFMVCEQNIFLTEYFGLWMVSECPPSYPFSDIQDKCTQEHIKHPVTADDGTVYRNLYCAVCHNVSRYKVWQFEFFYIGKCSPQRKSFLNTTIPEKISYIINNKCKYWFTPSSNSKLRSCFNIAFSNDTDNALCLKYQNPVYVIVEKMLYRNNHCRIKTKNFTAFCVLPEERFDADNRDGYSNLRLTGIFNIHPIFEWSGVKSCLDEKYHYDKNTDTCVPNTCLERQTETCDSEYIKNFKWNKPLSFITDNTIDELFILRLVAFVYISLPVDAYNIVTEKIYIFYQCGYNFTDEAKPCCTIEVSVNFINHVLMTIDSTLKFQDEANNMSWHYQEIHDKIVITASDTDTCDVNGGPQLKVHQQNSGVFDAVKSQFVVHNMRKHSMLIPEHIKGVVVVADRGDGEIPKLKLEHYELRYKEHNLTNDTIVNNKKNEVSNGWSVGTILTYTTLGCSCYFLMLTLGVYGYFGLFQSPPGVISKHMMTIMLAAQLLFIVGVGANYLGILCTIIGIVSHYLWLSSFTWISLFLFGILKMMRQLDSSPGALVEEQKLSKAVYCTGYMVPFLIVLPCALLEYLTDIQIGYNGQFCFLTGFMANFLSFTLPIVLSLCFNIVALIVSSITLARYNNTAKRLHSVRQARSFLPIYIRLCILCACPWMLGIIADIIQIDILDYIFIILSGSHGVFVGISFMCTQTVRNSIWRNRNRRRDMK